jgi:hypothetical protein
VTVFDLARLLVVQSIPEVGFLLAHKPVYIPMLIAEKKTFDVWNIYTKIHVYRVSY